MIPTIYMMVGLPASGKSTYAKFLAEEINGIVVSSDGIRAEWYGSEEILGNACKIFREVECRSKEALGRGRSVVIDATNMNAKKRVNFLKQMPACNKVCIVMATPFDVCVERDAIRSRSVGIEVIERMRKNFQMPYDNEGWDHIEIYYPRDCDMVNAAEHYNIEIAFDQKNKHHTLTVGIHEEKARDIASGKGYGIAVSWAAGFHDCGKIWCQHFDEGDENAHYYGHENVSAYQFLTTDAAQMMYALGNHQMVIDTASLITWHMVPYHFKKEDCPYDALMEWGMKKGFTKEYINKVWQLHQCDVAAH